ncbi:MAG TPA: response regulator [Stellaceae bacterium]|jgi:DNA-binding response OmpR family regulator|nr:response regulator [Stellaceae bacterium]
MTAGLQGFRILVVEDEFLVATLIQDILETAGCVVSGPIPRLAEAVSAAEVETCDAAVLDINLGGHRVFPVAEILSRRQIPFVFVTGYAVDSLPGEHHGRPTIRKPFSNQELVNTVASLMNAAA